MPEGPELHLAARLVNARCDGAVFSSPVIKSAVSVRNPDVSFDSASFSISARARGKQIKLFLTDLKHPKRNFTHILFRFGMSGCFQFTEAGHTHKHAHLQFYTKDKSHVLSFVDPRRFGRWEVEADWGEDRGPDPIFEYQAFREKVLSNLEEDAAFARPICEVMMNQKYFNGVGNYLRAEILHRCGVRPFDPARDVLRGCKVKAEPEVKVKGEAGAEVKAETEVDDDLLAATSKVMSEVLNLSGGNGYMVDADAESRSAFDSWLRCYSRAGMNNLVDAQGRTVWFSGRPGPMAPKNARSRGNKNKAKVTTTKEEASSPPKRTRTTRSKNKAD